MAITEGKDFYESSIDNILVGLYYYLLDDELIKENKGNSAVVGFADSIQSLTYNPFINKDDFNLLKIPFDTSRYGKIEGYTNVNVFKIQNSVTKDIILDDNNPIFKSKPSSVLIEEMESKLQLYPYRYFMICDYINPPLIIQPQLIKSSNNKIIVRVKIVVSNNSKYNLYVENYKGDNLGNLEGTINGDSLQLPVSSSAYSQFYATQSAQFRTNNNLLMAENDLSLKHVNQSENYSIGANLASGVVSGIGLNFGEMANDFVSIGSSMINKSQAREVNQFKNEQVTTMALAKKQDLMSTPRALKSLGGDTIFTLSNANKCVEILEYEMQDEFKSRIANYFHRFGYKINFYDKNSNGFRKTRKNFNYVKYVNCDVISNGRIPKNDMAEIKNIFESGVTFWNVYNNIKILDYNNVNEEV